MPSRKIFMAPRSTTSPSGRGGRDRASEGNERALGRVEGVRDAERDGLVAAGVAERRPEDEGNAERLEPLRQHLVAAFGGLADAEEVADHDALRAFERSGLEKLGAQAVEAIRRLVQVFEEHDAAVEAGLQRCAAQACEDREIPAAQRALRASATHGVRRPMNPSRVLSREEHTEPLEGRAIFSQLGAHRAVDARDARAPPELVQDGRVAVADHGFRALLDEIGGHLRDDALQPVTAARQDQRLDARVLQGMAKLLEAPLVVAREIALVSLEDALAEPRLETDVLQRADAALEAFLVERAGGRDYRDSVAGSERGRTRHAAMLARPSGTCTQGKRLAGLHAKIARKLEGALRDGRHGSQGTARHLLRVGARERSAEELVQQLQIRSEGVGVHGILRCSRAGTVALPPGPSRRQVVRRLGSVRPFRRRGLPNRDEASPLPETTPDALLGSCGARPGPKRDGPGSEGPARRRRRAIHQSRQNTSAEPTNPSEIKMFEKCQSGGPAALRKGLLTVVTVGSTISSECTRRATIASPFHFATSR